MSLQVKSNHAGIKVEEIDGSDIRRKLIDMNIAVNQPGVDPQFKEAMLPTSMFWYDQPRFFRIHGQNRVPFPGALVQALSGGKVQARLQVVALDKMVVKVAIRNVQVPGHDGRFVSHSKVPSKPDEERDNMHAVWSPQSNITFELVSSEPAIVDDRNASTKAELAKSMGLKDPSTAVFPPEIEPLKFREFFKKMMVDQAHITFFVVDKLTGGRSGNMSPLGLGFIAGNHGATTFAHEAGHFLGGHVENGQWHDLGHTFNKDRDQDVRELMREGGAGWKIPFDLVKTFRGFFRRHPVH
jgi:hypothetical protein